MSISIQEAYKTLDTLQQMADNPELIMTGLFSKGVSDMNFPYQVNINGKYIFDYLKEYLQKIPVFKYCVVRICSADVYIDIPGLKYGKYNEFQTNDNIIRFNIIGRGYTTTSGEVINNYQDIMSKTYELEVKGIEEFWRRFEDLSLVSCIRNAFSSFHSSKKIHVRVQDFFFWLYIPFKKRKVSEVLQKQYDKLESNNKWAKEQYEKDIARQKFYREHAPKQIEKIKKKQEEIVQYLNGLGYVENADKSF